jgi:SAM-dependent methyltransferase
MIGETEGLMSILDIGGCPQYWELMAAGMALVQRLHVTLLNMEPYTVSCNNYTALVGDARSMPQFADQQFDIVFSNSTIEHVGNFADQLRMANEIKRIGRKYCVQTPNRYFPIEPHFVFPLFQFLPIGLQVILLRHFDMGWYPRTRDRREAERHVSSIRLLCRKEVEQLFPEASIFEERYYGLVKSFVAYTDYA